MKAIEIITSHNITIQYELASVIDRFLSLLLDLVILVVYFCIVLFIVLGVGGERALSSFVWYFLWMPFFLFYNLICESFFNGQSLGKRALAIRVVKLNGQSPSLGDYILRWIFRIIDLGITMGALAALFVSSTEKSQRIGDMVAGTAVIKLNPKNKFTMQDIMSIKNTDGYEPKYVEAANLSEEDMLVVKNALERLRKYPNTAHKKLVDELCEKIGNELQIPVPEKKTAFLKTLLQDYIVLTR